MLYFKHAELAEKYHVSLKTVHNWIDAAKQGKIPLRLHTVSSRTYIADTPENTVVLKQLSEKGKKYRNSLHHKVVQPIPEFYKIFNHKQILDIVTSLSVHRELPKQYDYLEDGAKNWDNWLSQLQTDSKTSNTFSATIQLLEVFRGPLDRLLTNKRINVIDLGAGNAYPVRQLLAHLHEKHSLNRYIAIDISASMLEIAESNIKQWFGEDFPFESYVRDIAYEHFDDIVVEDMLDSQADQTVNLVLLLGDTINNLPSPNNVLKAAYDSMGINDLIVFPTKLDSEVSRRYFNWPNNLQASDLNGYLLNLISLDGSLYDIEMGFDEGRMMRYVRIRLKTALTIDFSFGTIKREVSFEKGETILLHRIWHKTSIEIIAQFEAAGFKLIQSGLSDDRQYVLTISGVEVQRSTEL